MKTPFIAIVLLTTAMVAGFVTACNTTQQRTAANTLGAVHATVDAAVDGYFSATIKGLAPTNDIPKVSKAYVDFQKAYVLAVDLAQNNTNALVDVNLQQEAADLISLVGQLYNPSLQKIKPTP